jgi:hypothetical protein
MKHPLLFLSIRLLLVQEPQSCVLLSELELPQEQ